LRWFCFEHSNTALRASDKGGRFDVGDRRRNYRASIARDGVMRGLSVARIEKSDLRTSLTNPKRSLAAWRHLHKFEKQLVRESAQEWTSRSALRRTRFKPPALLLQRTDAQPIGTRQASPQSRRAPK
jgi:hypothetical protein